ncbi:hypothetical protein [Butyrivibrio sp. VCB2006]|uniref:hypothetical protein n=1 Tax=Butyrivibrio sp. VCB2006 TaxID=1280679 RepID=UPI000406EF67|nr:hypothetical protein [Butyrivibrio sp. VCB2006]
MHILVNIKQIGKKKNKIDKMSFYLENKPQTVRDLITECVRTCVSDYNEQVKKGEVYKPLSTEEIDDMASIGKIAFGINYGGKLADEKKAVKNALQSYEDGLFCIFVEGKALGSSGDIIEEEVSDKESVLDERVTIEENTEVTFIRLVMLSGRMW